MVIIKIFGLICKTYKEIWHVIIIIMKLFINDMGRMAAQNTGESL